MIINALRRVPGSTDTERLESDRDIIASDWPSYFFLIDSTWFEYAGPQLIRWDAVPDGREMLDELKISPPLRCDAIYNNGESILCTLIDGRAIGVELTLVRFDPFQSWPVVFFYEKEEMDALRPYLAKYYDVMVLPTA